MYKIINDKNVTNQITKDKNIFNCTIRLLTFTREENCKAKSVIQNLIKVSCVIKVVQRNVKHLYWSKNNITTHYDLERRKRNLKGVLHEAHASRLKKPLVELLVLLYTALNTIEQRMTVTTSDTMHLRNIGLRL